MERKEKGRKGKESPKTSHLFQCGLVALTGGTDGKQAGNVLCLSPLLDSLILRSHACLPLSGFNLLILWNTASSTFLVKDIGEAKVESPSV